MGICFSCLEPNTKKPYTALLDDYDEERINTRVLHQSSSFSNMLKNGSDTCTLTTTIAILLASKFCRESKLYQWREEMLHNIGKRGYKYSFLVDLLNIGGDAQSLMMLSILPKATSPLSISSDSSLHKLKMLLVALKHPLLVPVMDLSFSREKQAFIILHPFVAQGSLKDRLHNNVDPKQSYVSKYQNYNRTPLKLAEIAMYGRHILEALAALRKKDIICQHLSTSNILIVDGIAKITDMENTILAIDRYYEIKERTLPLESKVDLDIILFGHVLYEMCFADELEKPWPEKYEIEDLDDNLMEVFNLIFYPDEKSEERVCAKDLMSCKFFQSVQVPLYPSIKLDSQMKSTLRNCMSVNQNRRAVLIQRYNEKKRKEMEEEHKKMEVEKLRAQEIKMAVYKQRNQRKASLKGLRRSSYRSSLGKSSADPPGPALHVKNLDNIDSVAAS